MRWLQIVLKCHIFGSKCFAHWQSKSYTVVQNTHVSYGRDVVAYCGFFLETSSWKLWRQIFGVSACTTLAKSPFLVPASTPTATTSRMIIKTSVTTTMISTFSSRVFGEQRQYCSRTTLLHTEENRMIASVVTMLERANTHLLTNAS